MSTERYEIKGKIGAGGVGAVYHAYDTHLHRDVAIKRVLADGGHEGQEDATDSLLKEATALSSVQHPHIVTVYDAGIDSDGPYVVMELIHGRTLDEMVESATMTWNDLREVALQSQEALIAAQDLDLVHRDLKPSNLMVCWLPSGKFQVKIVDFGLAKFSSAPSLQTVAHGDAVFGSIFFMAPEQFERVPLDKCTDMYSMGCLYYFALTGEYPFNGESAAGVMASHLQHHVTPLHEIRPDIPKWGADWIMWHIERDMGARPQDARESLARFLQLDQQSTQPITLSAQPPQAQASVGANPISVAPPQATGPKLLFPSPTESDTQPVNPQTAAQQPIQPPSQKLNIHTTPQNTTPTLLTAAQPITDPQAVAPQASQPVSAPQNTTPTLLTAAQPITSPQAAVAPQASQPVSAPQNTTATQLTAAQPTAAPQAATEPQAPQFSLAGAPSAQAATTQQEETQPKAFQVEEPKKGLPPIAKWTIIVTLSIVIALVTMVILNKMGEQKKAKIYNTAMKETKALYDEGELQNGYKMKRETLDVILERAVDDKLKEKNRKIQRAALAYAIGDGFNADEVIVNYLTTKKINPNIRSDLFKYTMARRQKTSNIKPLLEFAINSNNEKEATQAILAAKASCKGTEAADYFEDFLSLINNTDKNSLRNAAVKAAKEIISQASNKEKFAQQINIAYNNSIDESPKYALIRLMAASGSKSSAKIIKEALSSNNQPLKNAAISSLGKWTNDEQFKMLNDFISDTNSKSLRKTAFDTAFRFLRNNNTERKQKDLANLWKTFSNSAETQYEKLLVIGGLGKQEQQWALTLVRKYLKDKDEEVHFKAEETEDYLKNNIRKNK